MKKIIIILLLLITYSVSIQAQVPPAACCPKFKLVSSPINPCDDRGCKDSLTTDAGGTAGGNPATGHPMPSLMACKNQTQTYYVTPALLGFTYNWTVIGGTIASTTANPGVITWGSGNTGYIQIIIKNADSTCRDTITKKVCLLDGPTAAITYNPATICIGGSVNFSGAGSIGGNVYYWNFGDGTSSNLQNPPAHIYNTPGPKTIILTVSSSISYYGVTRDCGCSDTAMVTINVNGTAGIDIYTDDCRKMLCAGDTVKYCTSTTSCSGLVWGANGGTVISGQGTTCATIVWNNPPTSLPTAVTLNATCSGVCGNSASLNVPILFTNLPIQGPYNVCPSSTASYSLPALPGTFYKWTISGGGNIVGYDSNHNVINVQWGATAGGPYIITCNYNNPYSKCSGTDTIGVYIKPVFKLTGLSPICVGQSSSVCANGPVGIWTPSVGVGYTINSTTPTCQNITWNVAGSYTISATPSIPANFCSSPALINIVVVDTPKINAIVGLTTICPNQMYPYSVSSNITTASFVWSFVSGTGTISSYGTNNSNASINFTGTGPWVLQVAQTVNGCTKYKQLTITKAGPPPAITLSAASVCSGGTITANVTGAIPTGGYTWSTTSGAVLVGANGGTSATITVNSNATITLTSCGGSVSIPVAATTATVSITQTVSTPVACNAILTASPGGGTYQWYLNGNPVAIGNPITATQNGTYVVVATYAGGCKANSSIVVTGITPVSVSITGIGNICSPSTVVITASVSANCTGATYAWSNGAPGNPTSISVTTPGSYSVTITCANGCTATSNVIVVENCNGGSSGGSCIPDALITGNNNCNNPINLSITPPSGCTPTGQYWFYGDGTSGSTGTHTYTNVGTYIVKGGITCTDGSNHCDSQLVIIPMVDSFTHVITCGVNGWNLSLTDASIFLPSYAGYTRTWSVSPACPGLNLVAVGTGATANLFVPVGCNPTVTLTISKNGCTLTKSFTFSFPTTAFSIVGNNKPCKGVDYVYTSSIGPNIISYAWNFGDGTSGVTNPITHHFSGTPANPTIGLTVTDKWGCQFSTSMPVNVIIPPILKITPKSIIYICQDCVTPIKTLTATPAASFTNFLWYHNGVSTGVTTSTYQPCTFNASGNYYVTATPVGNASSCPVISDTVIVMYYPKPIAKITGQSVQCIGGATGTIYLQNSVNLPNYTYFWQVSPAATFTSGNTSFNVGVNATAGNTYQFILTVTDTTGCVAKDTFCVYVYRSPTVTIAPTGYLCEGIIHTYTATALPTGPSYVYQWSNGATGATMTTEAAGNYYVSILNPASGCTATSNTVTIKKRPYVDLFPIGCDTLCDTAKIIPPLPLGPGQTYGSLYVIKWYVDGVYHSTGSLLNLTGIPLGGHQIHIVVNFLGDTCASTSGKYNVFIKDCDKDCCKGSYWKEEPSYIAASKETKIDCTKETVILITGVDCKKPLVIGAAIQCPTADCGSKDSVFVYDNFNNIVLSGPAPLTITGLANGNYTVLINGYCGGVLCLTCKLFIKVDCIDVKCECNPQEPLSLQLSINDKVKQIECGGSLGKIDCKNNVVLNGSYFCNFKACPTQLTYSLNGPSGTTTGSLPLTLSSLTPGSYSIVIQAFCDGVLCKKCKFEFTVDCDKPCCPYEIKATPKEVTYTPSTTSTLVSNIFSISGIPSTANITEVRANVLSYTIDDNFKGDCMKCVNLPFTWASVATATNVNAAPPKITMFGGATVPTFNGSGAGAYQNPREIIWNNGSNLNSPNITNIGMSFILPPTPTIDCCELKGKICVKFIFRDDKCNECEVIGCFELVLKKK